MTAVLRSAGCSFFFLQFPFTGCRFALVLGWTGPGEGVGGGAAKIQIKIMTKTVKILS